MNDRAMRGFVNLVIFGAGLATGYFIAKKKYEQLVDDFEDSLEDMSKEDEAPKDKQMTYTEYINRPEFDGTSEEEILKARAHHKRALGGREDVTDYTSYYKKPDLAEMANKIRETPEDMSSNYKEFDDYEEPEYEDEDDEDEDDYDEENNSQDMSLSAVHSNIPYVITNDQYDEECLHYDKLDWFLYLQDGVVCDEADNVISDEDYDQVHSDELDRTIDKGVNHVCVRNEKLGTDYIIHCINESYNEVIMNSIETPSEREYRHLARLKAARDDM